MKTISQDVEDADANISKKAAKTYTGRESASGQSESRRNSARLQEVAAKSGGHSSPPPVRRGSRPLDSIKEPAFTASGGHEVGRARAPSLVGFEQSEN